MENRKPHWLKKKIPNKEGLIIMAKMLKKLSLNTVCEGADCPNIGECFNDKTATFMILGRVCTRNCRFCAVTKGEASLVDKEEATNVALAVRELNLKHVVITSVTRDDLEDGGAQHFVDTITEVRKYNSNTSIEVLIPDFKGNQSAIQKVIDIRPEIINHNIETVPSLYSQVRPEAVYTTSLNLLRQVKYSNKDIITKTGLMVGLGETTEEVLKVMDDLIKIHCDILTIGQYLKPTKGHIDIKEFITPEKFDYYREIGIMKGFKFVASGPFVRSSYKAIEGLQNVENFELNNI